MPQPEGAELDRIREHRDQLRITYLKAPPGPPPARGIHHVALICRDVEETINFYQGLLGFPLVEMVENRDYAGSTHFFFDVGHGNLLGFFDFPGHDHPGKVDSLPLALQRLRIGTRTQRRFVQRDTERVQERQVGAVSGKRENKVILERDLPLGSSQQHGFGSDFQDSGVKIRLDLAGFNPIFDIGLDPILNSIRDPGAAMHQRAMVDPIWMKLRREMAEHPFGTMKWLMGHPRFLVRGLTKAKAELALTVLSYNLKRVINILGVPALLKALQPTPA